MGAPLRREGGPVSDPGGAPHGGLMFPPPACSDVRRSPPPPPSVSIAPSASPSLRLRPGGGPGRAALLRPPSWDPLPSRRAAPAPLHVLTLARGSRLASARSSYLCFLILPSLCFSVVASPQYFPRRKTAHATRSYLRICISKMGLLWQLKWSPVAL